ncbi:MAG: YdeI/OmpD-associated family protein [candidate division FCPU426 bacterium]
MPAIPPVLAFPDAKTFRAWLARHHTLAEGIWLRFFKKDSDKKSVTYDQALDEALCFGWIDGQAKSHDEKSWLQKFTPRRPRSVWSKRNQERVERLRKAKRLMPPGLEAVAAAKADGRWAAAYDSPQNMQVPKDFLAALAKHPKAVKFYQTLNRANTYAIAWRLQTAKKPETRQKRLAALLEMMKQGKKLH